jgi:hypothetical protein
MNNADTLISHWLIPIATNIIAAIIIFLGRPSLALGKRLLAKGKSKLNVKPKFRNKPIKASVQYLAWVLVGVLPIIYNVIMLYRYTIAAGPPTRSEVLLVFVYLGLIGYWLRITIDKLRHYGPSDYM